MCHFQTQPTETSHTWSYTFSSSSTSWMVTLWMTLRVWVKGGRTCVSVGPWMVPATLNCDIHMKPLRSGGCLLLWQLVYPDHTMYFTIWKVQIKSYLVSTQLMAWVTRALIEKSISSHIMLNTISTPNHPRNVWGTVPRTMVFQNHALSLVIAIWLVLHNRMVMGRLPTAAG